MEQIQKIFEKFRELSTPEHIKKLNDQFENFERYADDYVKRYCNGYFVAHGLITEENQLTVSVVGPGHILEPVTISRQEYILSEFIDLKNEFFSRISVLFESFLFQTSNDALIEIITGCKYLHTKDDFVAKFFKSFQSDIVTKHSIWNESGRKDLPFDVSYPKIEWTAELKQLTTLFRQLFYDKKNKSKPFIKCELDDLIDLIYQNFYSINKKPFDRDTIRDYLSDGNEDVLRSEKGPFVCEYGCKELRNAGRKR